MHMLITRSKRNSRIDLVTDHWHVGKKAINSESPERAYGRSDPEFFCNFNLFLENQATLAF